VVGRQGPEARPVRPRRGPTAGRRAAHGVGEDDHPARPRGGRDQLVDVDREVGAHLDAVDGRAHQGRIILVQGEGRIERHHPVSRPHHGPRHDREELLGPLADHDPAARHAEPGAERGAQPQAGRIGVEPEIAHRPARGRDGARTGPQRALVRSELRDPGRRVALRHFGEGQPGVVGGQIQDLRPHQSGRTRHRNPLPEVASPRRPARLDIAVGS